MPTSELRGTKMLLATDGSGEAELATKSAVELADSTGSELHVVYVGPLPDFMKKNDAGAPGYDRELYEMIEEEGRDKLRKLTWRVKAAGGTVTGSHLRMGAVAEEIVALADELEVDLIIVGSRGVRGIRRALAGSVSEGVFRHARCPVMVVRAKGNTPSRRGGRRPPARRVFWQEVRPLRVRVPLQHRTPFEDLRALVQHPDDLCASSWEKNSSPPRGRSIAPCAVLVAEADAPYQHLAGPPISRAPRSRLLTSTPCNLPHLPPTT